MAKRQMTSKEVEEFTTHLHYVNKYNSVDYKLLKEYQDEQLILNGVR